MSACACLGCTRKPKHGPCPCGKNCNCRCTLKAEAPVPDPICAEPDCPNIVESSENYCTDCLDRMSGG